MEGPTPVSALIHAATMVTAGIYVVIRSLSFFEYSEVALQLMTVIGALTSFYGALMCTLQNDIKKIIAYSTCSQLGYMVLACGLSEYDVCMFHLTNHAFFKALLFLSAGIIIHSMNGEQNIHKMGGLLYPLSLTYILLFIGSMSLMGFPGTSGYFSKEKILEVAFSSSTVIGK